jgi:hypothetical protein
MIALLLLLLLPVVGDVLKGAVLCGCSLDCC